MFLTKDNANLLMAILTGEKESLSENTIQNFQNGSLIHILCVSGAHISFLLLGVQKLFERLGRKKKYIFSLLVLICLNIITGFSASVMRASIMASCMIASKLVYRKKDTGNAIALSLLVLLLYNPFLLFDTGLLLSYGGTIGIIAFERVIEGEKLKDCGKVKSYIGKIVITSCAAQIVLSPMIAYLFQKTYPSFFISTLLATPLFELILICGCFFLCLIYIFPPICYGISVLLNAILSIFSKIAEISANLPFSYFYVVKPSVLLCMFYYTTIFMLRFFYLQKINVITLRYTQKKWMAKIQTFKTKITLKRVVISLCTLLVLSFSIRWAPGKFNICFVDVGQGDCTFLQTSHHKTMLIDSGGTEDKDSYDVGEKILVPYLLGKGITKIDYIVISHFHADHCNGFLAVLEAIKVENMLIAKQEVYTKEAEELIKLAQQKKVKVCYVETGKVITIDKDTKLEILYVGKSKENLNNTSIIARLIYRDFKMLFTGDAEVEEEQEFLKQYKNQEVMSNVLKVGHHGSSTSTSEALLKKIKPSIALIGVGEKNTFGHPSEEIVKRLQRQQCRIYRTDESGEIVLEITRNGKIKMQEHILKYK